MDDFDVAPIPLQPSPEGERRHWGTYPEDEIDYEAFIRCVLERASTGGAGGAMASVAPGLPQSVPIRYPMGGDADLPPYGRARTPVLHGIIDWVNESEDAAVLQEVADDGWIDPDLLHVGSASRSLGEDDIVQVEPYLLQIVSRALSFVTLTCPTWIENKRPEQRDLHNRLVRKLLDLRWTQLDTLYGWLDEMFRFAEGATVAYYARYTPSPRIVEKAAGHGVVLRALPLSVIPEALLRRHRRFRFMHMTTAQWRELRDMLEAKGRYDLAAVLRAHDTDPT